MGRRDDSDVVQGNGPSLVSRRLLPLDHCRRWRQQGLSVEALESGVADTRQPVADAHKSLPSAAGNQEVEQDRASALFLYHAELAGAAPGVASRHFLADCGPPDPSGGGGGVVARRKGPM